MTKDEVEGWVHAGYATATAALSLGASWWPTTTGDNQSKATAWATATFLHAGLELCFARELITACPVGINEATKKVVDAIWTTDSSRTHQPEQVLLDFTIRNPEATSPLQVTGESEMGPSHGVGTSTRGSDGYSWDFYKLLLVPSPTRLFAARVAADGASAVDRTRTLAASLRGLIDWYGPAMLRPNDEVGGFIIPATKADAAETLVLWTERGRFRFEKITKSPIP
jgi:hypothetical protein